MTQTLCLGKLPARPGAVKLRFADYVTTVQMPDPGYDFGHENLVKDWKMLANDQAGCCYVSWASHADMLWTAEGGAPAEFSDASTIAYYQELTKQFNGVAFDPSQTDSVTGENPTDTGIDMSRALPLLQKVGIPDVTGKRHVIGAYVALEPGNVGQLRFATKYFDGVGIGINMARQWMQAFQQGNYIWQSLADPEWIGGHCIGSVAWRDGVPVIVSWGKPVQFTLSAYTQSCDEAYACISLDKLINGVDLDGLDLPKLTADIKDLTSIDVTSKDWWERHL